MPNRPCPNCKAQVAVAYETRPTIGRCFSCFRRFTVWSDESVHALCACGQAHDKEGHPK